MQYSCSHCWYLTLLTGLSNSLGMSLDTALYLHSTFGNTLSWGYLHILKVFIKEKCCLRFSWNVQWRNQRTPTFLSLMHFIGWSKILLNILMTFCDKEGQMKASMSSILGHRPLKIVSLKMRSKWQTTYIDSYWNFFVYLQSTWTSPRIYTLYFSASIWTHYIFPFRPSKNRDQAP